MGQILGLGIASGKMAEGSGLLVRSLALRFV